jgi:hypothetical protein
MKSDSRLVISTSAAGTGPKLSGQVLHRLKNPKIVSTQVFRGTSSLFAAMEAGSTETSAGRLTGGTVPTRARCLTAIKNANEANLKL